jgi:hypothetical protein
MIIDRREFMAGAALAVVTPTLELLPAQASQPVRNVKYPTFMIDGWSLPGRSEVANEVWMRVDRSWRAAWR